MNRGRFRVREVAGTIVQSAYAEQVRERTEKSLRRRAKELGYELVKKADAASPEASDMPLSV